MEPKHQKSSIGYFIVVLVALFLLQSVLFAPHAETLSYSEATADLLKTPLPDSGHLQEEEAAYHVGQP